MHGEMATCLAGTAFTLGWIPATKLEACGKTVSVLPSPSVSTETLPS